MSADFFKTLFLATVPPFEGSVRRRTFDISVAVAIYALIFVSLWAAGTFPRQFGQGYALASDVTDKLDAATQRINRAQMVLNDIQVRTVRDDIRTNEIIRCKILADNKADGDLRARALDSVNQAIDTSVGKYYTFTKQVYQQEPCEVLLIGGR